MRRCPKCKQLRATDNFPLNTLKHHAPRTWYECVFCKRDRNNLRNRALRVRVLQHYGGTPPKCACCSEAHLEFLALDHINGGGRKHRQTVKMTWWQWLWKHDFPAGFRVLCHNCNQALGVYGRCPHQGPVSALDAAFLAYDPFKPSLSCKLTEGQVRAIRQQIVDGVPQCQIAQQYRVSRATICNINKVKIWTHVQ